MGEPFNYRALNLIDGAERVDNLTADICGNPNLVNANFVCAINADLGDLSKVSGVTVMKRHAFASSF